MYFKGTLKLDPSKSTKLEKQYPDDLISFLVKLFKEGKVTDMVERETFSSIQLATQLHRVFHSLGINNLVRLSHDGNDFDIDAQGRKDDLKTILAWYHKHLSPKASQHWNSFQLVLEHQAGPFKYLIEVEVEQFHVKGEPPIKIEVCALLNDFKAELNETSDQIRRRLAPHFASQGAHEGYKIERNHEFTQFMEELAATFYEHMQLDDVQLAHSPCLLITPFLPPTASKVAAQEDSEDAIFHGYRGLQESTFYLFYWAELAAKYELHLSNFTVTDSYGQELGRIQTPGIRAHLDKLFNMNLSIEQRIADLKKRSRNWTNTRMVTPGNVSARAAS